MAHQPTGKAGDVAPSVARSGRGYFLRMNMGILREPGSLVESGMVAE